MSLAFIWASNIDFRSPAISWFWLVSDERVTLSSTVAFKKWVTFIWRNWKHLTVQRKYAARNTISKDGHRPLCCVRVLQCTVFLSGADFVHENRNLWNNEAQYYFKTVAVWYVLTSQQTVTSVIPFCLAGLSSCVALTVNHHLLPLLNSKAKAPSADQWTDAGCLFLFWRLQIKQTDCPVVYTLGVFEVWVGRLKRIHWQKMECIRI